MPENKLYQCPYSKAAKCSLTDCCLECETFGEYNLQSKTTKNSWTREEVIDLIHFFRCDILTEVQKEGKVVNFTEKWIESNL